MRPPSRHFSVTAGTPCSRPPTQYACFQAWRHAHAWSRAIGSRVRRGTAPIYARLEVEADERPRRPIRFRSESGYSWHWQKVRQTER
eukprot:scaffold50749_cov25-Tisochrysis_lutea.AAC.6